MNFANAWKCDECPECNDGKGCPAWMELAETNRQGEVRINKICLFVYFPQLVVQLIMAANRPAAAVESCRNEIAKGFNTLAGLSALGMSPLTPKAPLISIKGGKTDAVETGRCDEAHEGSGDAESPAPME